MQDWPIQGTFNAVVVLNAQLKGLNFREKRVIGKNIWL
jgi:hypothetical protein